MQETEAYLQECKNLLFVVSALSLEHQRFFRNWAGEEKVCRDLHSAISIEFVCLMLYSSGFRKVVHSNYGYISVAYLFSDKWENIRKTIISYTMPDNWDDRCFLCRKQGRNKEFYLISKRKTLCFLLLFTQFHRSA